MTMSSQDVVTNFIAQVDAILQGENAAPEDLLAHDVVVEVIGSTPLSGLYRGRSETLTLLARTAARRIASGSVELLSAISAVEDVGVFLRLRLVTPEGRIYNAAADPAGCYFQVRNGKITEVRFFPDTTQIETELYGRQLVPDRPASGSTK